MENGQKPTDSSRSSDDGDVKYPEEKKEEHWVRLLKLRRLPQGVPVEIDPRCIC